MPRSGLARAERLGPILLGGAVLAAAVLYLWETRGQTFYSDEWNRYVIERGHSLTALIRPSDGGHLVLVPRLVYKALLELFGAGDYLPYRLVALGLGSLASVLLYVWGRRRVGPLLALAPSVLLLFFGAGWDVVVTPHGIGILLAVCAGLGAFVAIERDDRAGDAATCALLIVGLASNGVGLGFAAGATVYVLIRPAAERWRRLWVGVPLGLYAAWWAWAHAIREFSTSNPVRASNIPNLPSTGYDCLAAVSAAISGLFRTPGQGGVDFRIDQGEVIAALLALALAAHLLRGPRPIRPGVWVVLAPPLVYWLTIGIVMGYGRTPHESRYLYPGAVFVLLVVLELARRERPSIRALSLAAGLLAVSLVANLGAYHDAATLLRHDAAQDRAELGALTLARDQVDPAFSPEPLDPVTLTPYDDLRFELGDYLSAAAAFGTPADSPSRLAAASAEARGRADLVLSHGLRLGLAAATATSGARTKAGAGRIRAEVLGGRLTRRGGCLTVAPQPGAPGVLAVLTLPPGGATLATGRGGQPVGVSVSRFGEPPGVALGSVAAGAGATLAIPVDASPAPWRLTLTGPGRTTACPLGAA